MKCQVFYTFFDVDVSVRGFVKTFYQAKIHAVDDQRHQNRNLNRNGQFAVNLNWSLVWILES